MSPTLPTPPTLAPPPTRTDTVATVATVDTDSSVVEVVALDDLIGMVTDPVKGFLREQLGIRLNDPDEAIDPVESFDLQGLDRYQVRTRMVEALLRGESPEHIFSLLNADALLQPGAHGVITFQDELAMLSPFVAALSALRRTFIAAARTVSIQLDFDSSDRVDGRTHWRIEGDVHDVYHHTGRGNESSLVHWKAGEFKPSGPNGWIALWIRHLALNAASGRTQTLVMQSAVSLTQPIVLSAINADDARACLRDWLWLFGSARQRLEKFWPAAAFAYAKRAIERKAGEDGNGAGNRAIKAAHEAWTPSYSDARFAGRAESARPYNALAARDDPHPLDQSFVGWAERLMVPLANAIQASETTKISDVTEAPNS